MCQPRRSRAEVSWSIRMGLQMPERETFFGGLRKIAAGASALKKDERGASALEFAIFAGMLAFGLLNTADISIYIYKRMQLENATEMAAQAAWKACDPSKGYLPATLSCPNLTSTITQAAQSTSLGTQVTIAVNSP